MRHAVLALILLGISTSQAASSYTKRMFRRAMSKDNMAISESLGLSPLFVLITLRDKRGQERTVCTLASFLTGAIIEEYYLGYDIPGERKAFQIAVTAPNRTFAFTNRRAIRNVQPRYTPEQLATARLCLAKKSRTQLRAEVEKDYSDVTKLYRRYYTDRPGFWHSDEWRDAVAHVSLERGVLVGEAHGTAPHSSISTMRPNQSLQPTASRFDD
jgi:hypothetical protein